MESNMCAVFHLRKVAGFELHELKKAPSAETTGLTFTSNYTSALWNKVSLSTIVVYGNGSGPMASCPYIQTKPIFSFTLTPF